MSRKLATPQPTAFDSREVTRRGSGSQPRVLPVVLVVEDDPALRDWYVDALSDDGYAVVSVATLTEARAVWQTQLLTHVILDLTLEGEFGADFLAELAADPRGPSVVVVSAFPLAQMVCDRHGAILVKKPFELDVLLSEMRRATKELVGL